MNRIFNRESLWIASLCILLFAVQACWGQGCALCADSTRQTPPQVQAAYRHAILLMVGAGASIFLAGLILFRRER